VNLSKEALSLVKDEFDSESLGVVSVKGKGDLEIFRVVE